MECRSRRFPIFVTTPIPTSAFLLTKFLADKAAKGPAMSTTQHLGSGSRNGAVKEVPLELREGRMV